MHRNIIRDLIRPRRVDSEFDEGKYAKFVAEPLERGFGTTIGNSMRRILLSSLPGAAITNVQILNVKHEFSTIPGCVEDVTEIILNLKEVIIDLGDKDEAELRLEASGPAKIKAGLISGDPSVTIVNPDHHICELNQDGQIELVITARVGRGYVVAEENKGEETPVGSIAIDSVFSPVRKVNHSVTNARVGQRTDYDKLTLEVWTDGSMAPEEAMKGAAYILRDQLSVFVGEDVPVEEVKEVVEEDKPKFNEHLFKRIDELELSVRSSNCLENADIKYIGELVSRSEAEMLRTKNFGRKSLNEIKEILSEMGLYLGYKIEGFPGREELDRIAENSGSLIS